MLWRIAMVTLLAGTLAARPTPGAGAQDLPAFDPDTRVCSGPVDAPELAGPWETAVSADRPRVGETVTIGLRNPSSDRAPELVSALLLGPDGQPLDILDGQVCQRPVGGGGPHRGPARGAHRDLGPAVHRRLHRLHRLRRRSLAGGGWVRAGRNDIIVVKNEGTGTTTGFAVRVVVDDEDNEAKEHLEEGNDPWIDAERRLVRSPTGGPGGHAAALGLSPGRGLSGRRQRQYRRVF